MKSIIDIRIDTARGPARKPARERPLGSTAAVSVDLDAAHEVVSRFRVLSVRDASLKELNTGIADLTRAGVRADSRHAMIGRTLLGQLLAESERRAARPVDETRRAVAGSYTALVLRAEHDHAPKKYDRYN